MGVPYNAALLACFFFLKPDLGFNNLNFAEVLVFALNLTLNFSSNVHTFLFSELSLKGHLLIKVTNYTVIFSKFCNSTLCFVEALFLIASGRPWPSFPFLIW